MTDDDELFVRALVERLPVLEDRLKKHLAYYDEILSHVFLGEVSRWAVATCANTPASPDLAVLLSVLEDGRRAGASDTRDLIDQSFVENVCGEQLLAGRLPPLLAQRYLEICGS